VGRAIAGVLPQGTAREESPDTAVIGGNALDWRATRLLAAGGLVRKGRATDSATENKPPV